MAKLTYHAPASDRLLLLSVQLVRLALSSGRFVALEYHLSARAGMIAEFRERFAVPRPRIKIRKKKRFFRAFRGLISSRIPRESADSIWPLRCLRFPHSGALCDYGDPWLGECGPALQMGAAALP
jgi:hypothetical protein